MQRSLHWPVIHSQMSFEWCSGFDSETSLVQENTRQLLFVLLALSPTYMYAFLFFLKFRMLFIRTLYTQSFFKLKLVSIMSNHMLLNNF